jgi:hypothetical protein
VIRQRKDRDGLQVQAYARLRRQGGKGGRPLAASSVRQIHAILSAR